MKKSLQLFVSIICIAATISCNKSVIASEDYTGVYQGKTNQGEATTITVEHLDDSYYVTKIVTNINFVKSDGSIMQMPVVQSNFRGIVALNRNQFLISTDNNNPSAGFILGTVDVASKTMNGTIKIERVVNMVTGESSLVNTGYTLAKK